METTVQKKNRLTKHLIVVCLILAVVLGVMVFFCRIWDGKTPDSPREPSVEATLEATMRETEPPVTEPEPTQPPADPNPYGIYDFQYEGRYLKLLEGESITGIDVSAHQQQIDWEKVSSAGVKFAMIRVGYRGYGEAGNIVEDSYARDNLKAAAVAGLDVGVYFFSQAISVEEALEEAEFVLNILDGMELAMPVVYDWEYIGEDARTADVDRRTLTDCSLAFLNWIQEAGYWPMLYFNTMQSRKLLYLEELEQFDFWLALYSNRMTFPYKIKMWQYTCTGSVPGIAGNCDINVFFPEIN